MKVKQLRTIIRKMVVEEVKKQVNEIFIKEQVKPSRMVATKPVKRETVNYTDNSTLNKVLNETVGLSKTDKQLEEYPTMSGEAFDSSRMTELLGYGKPEEVRRDMVAVDTLQKAGKSVDDVPEHITNALTRDYSGLMKAIKDRKS